MADQPETVSDGPIEGQEATERPSLSARVIALPDGKKRALISSAQLNYVAEDGTLRDIVTEPRIDGSEFRVDDAPYLLRIDASAPAHLFRGRAGIISIELLSVGRGAINPQVGERADGAILWRGVGLDTDYEVVPKKTGVATFLTLHSAGAPKAWSWRVTGDTSLIRPLSGKDAEGRLCRIETQISGDILTATWNGKVTTRGLMRKNIPDEERWIEPTYPVRIDPSIEENLANSNDMGYSGSTFFNLDASMIVGKATWADLWGGIRLRTVAIPQGATIDSAVLSFYVGGRSGSPSINVYGYDVDDAPTWQPAVPVFSAMAKTTAVVNWQPPIGVNTRRSIDVKTIVQELVDRGGWASNNNLSFGFFPTAQSGYVTVSLFVGASPTTEIELLVDYTEGGGGGGAVTQGGISFQPIAFGVSGNASALHAIEEGV